MREIRIDEDGNIPIPEEYQDVKRLVIRLPYRVEVSNRIGEGNGYFKRSVQTYFRQKGKDKPYVPEGTVEFNRERFKVVGG